MKPRIFTAYRADGSIAWFATMNTDQQVLDAFVDYSQRGFVCTIMPEKE